MPGLKLMNVARVVNKNNCYIDDDGWLTSIIELSTDEFKGCIRTDKLRDNMDNLDIVTYIIYREHWKHKITYYTNIWTGLADVV